MSTIRLDIKKLAQEEFKSENLKPLMFCSDYEGAAVIIEKIERLKSAFSNVEFYFDGLWHGVKNNESTESSCRSITEAAIDAACEAIQVAAMAQKFIDNKNRRKENAFD